MLFEICRTHDDLVLMAGRYLGRSVLPSFISRVRGHGAAWCYYGDLMSNGRPVIRILQACRLSSGHFTIHDRTYTRDPGWSWVDQAEGIDQVPLPHPVFRTGSDLLKDRRRVVVPEYARPDVPAGE